MAVPARIRATMRRLNLRGVNKPKRTPSHKTKSHVVMASSGGRYKVVRFGQQGVSGAGKNPKSKAQKARRRAYYARHGRTTNKFSAKYWSNKVKW